MTKKKYTHISGSEMGKLQRRSTWLICRDDSMVVACEAVST